MLVNEVLVIEFLAVDGLSTGSVLSSNYNVSFCAIVTQDYKDDLQSPPWSMNCGMTLWKGELA